MTLNEFFAGNSRVALAFSGGVDSACLLQAAVERGVTVKAYYMSGPFQPAFERQDALRLARELGAELEVCEIDILAAPGVRENPADRCCHCKRAMFTALKAKADDDGFTLLIDGTNASDDEEDRPGMKALRELGVRSPLRECGITKEDVRRLSREAGLFTWDKPAYSCLATRIAVGEPITAERLARIERAETALFSLGFTDFRVRTCGKAARLQVTAAQMARAFGKRADICALLSGEFESVALDLNPREASR